MTGNDQRPDRKAEALGDRWATDASPTVQRRSDVTADLDPFTWGVLADAYNSGRKIWLLKRAEDFRAAKPVHGDYVGNKTRDQLSAQWRWLDEIERAFRAKAELVGVDEELEHLLRTVA